ncbi:MAG: sigma-54-dependent Fis family transcriptional regulator [Spirochaetales bacterium]|nr:sigma-54-dependent Fis family transcriptional regulator [Spirochaetales bacterium]
MGNLLIIDADPYLCDDVCHFFRSIGHTMRQATDLPSALALLAEQEFDVVVSDVRIPGGTIQELQAALREHNPDAALIVDSELDSIQEGVQAVSEGAFSILQKPFSIPELSFQIKRALERQGREQPQADLAERYRNVYRPYNFIGESPEIKKVFRIVNRVAATDSSVLITGETGTGKELVAGAIHYNSNRSDGPFVRVNCAALPEQLLESELFGYEAGAFTGADRRRVGRFEHADGGTIFLDEVADMSLFTQAKVLRVIQEKEFERLGSNETVKTDVRIISATNRDLLELMRKGDFREDLYYRLNVVTIRLPPLRERSGDIALLLQFFLKKYAAEMNKKIRGVDSAAQRMLTRYHWPGNIRELENTIERAVLLADGEVVTPEDLNLLFADPSQAAGGYADAEADAARAITLPPGGIRLEDAERGLIVQALERCDWVQKDAAALLGVSSRVLNYKIKHFGITHPRWKQNRAASENGG